MAEQLSFVFPQTFLPAIVEIQTIPLVHPNPFAGIVEQIWAERRAEAAQRDSAFWQRAADDNQLVLNFLDAGLTRNARKLARYFFLLPVSG